jgi:hypothetical protein
LDVTLRRTRTHDRSSKDLRRTINGELAHLRFRYRYPEGGQTWLRPFRFAA